MKKESSSIPLSDGVLVLMREWDELGDVILSAWVVMVNAPESKSDVNIYDRDAMPEGVVEDVCDRIIEHFSDLDTLVGTEQACLWLDSNLDSTINLALDNIEELEDEEEDDDDELDDEELDEDEEDPDA